MARPLTLLISLAAVLAAAPSLAAPTPGAPSLPGIPNPKIAAEAPEIGRSGGTLVDAQVSEPRTFNPIVYTDVSTGRALAQIFDGLVEANYITGEVEPALAAPWRGS